MNLTGHWRLPSKAFTPSVTHLVPFSFCPYPDVPPPLLASIFNCQVKSKSLTWEIWRRTATVSSLRETTSRECTLRLSSCIWFHCEPAHVQTFFVRRKLVLNVATLAGWTEQEEKLRIQVHFCHFKANLWVPSKCESHRLSVCDWMQDGVSY